MKVLEIEYPTTLDKIDHITDDNIDVFIDLEDGYSYAVIVTTLKNLETLMGDKPGSAPLTREMYKPSVPNRTIVI